MSAQRFITCPDCGDPNVPWNTPNLRCDLCSTVCEWKHRRDRKRCEVSNDPTVPALVERNLMDSLHVQHARSMRGATELRTCGTCGQTAGDYFHCVYCINGRHNPNTRAWTPRQQAPAAAAATFDPDLFPSGAERQTFSHLDFEAFRDLDPNFNFGNLPRELPKKARLIDISGIADRELACVICMEDIPAEAPRVYYCECQALICGACLTKPEVLRLEKCPVCRKNYKFA
jgi:hypothetical protein